MPNALATFKIQTFLRRPQINMKKILLFCPDHVISTARQMTNLVSNFEYLVLLSFLTAVSKLGAPSRYFKGALIQKR